MSNGVKVAYSELEPMRTELDNIITEFEQSSQRDSLRDGVDRPYGLNDLYDAAENFESRWDDRRKKLMDNCVSVRDHVVSVIDGFQEFDVESAVAFDSDES